MGDIWGDATPETVDERTARDFPGIAVEVCSPIDPAYNCAAWAVNDTETFWDDRLSYWPPGATRGPLVEHLAEAYALFGFEPCGLNDAIEPETDKIAIFESSGGNWSHACRQREDGRWWSKNNIFEDVKHDLMALEKCGYAKLAVILKRQRR